MQRSYCNKGNTHLDLSEYLIEKEDEDDFLHHIRLALDNFNLSLEQAESLIVNIDKMSCKQGDRPQLLANFKKLCNEALYNVGNTYFVWGKFDNKYFDNSLEFLKKAASYAKDLSNPILEGKCYSSIGLIFFNKKEYDQAEAYFKKDVKICEENRDYHGLILTLKNMARVYHARRDYQTSKEYF